MAIINAVAGQPFTAHLEGAPEGVEDWQVRVYDTTDAVVVGPAADDFDTLTEGVTWSDANPEEGLYTVELTAPVPADGYEPDENGLYVYTVAWMSEALGGESEPDALLVTLVADTTSALGRFRLELGDLNPSAYLFTDEQAAYFIDKHPTNLLLAVADACDALAARFAPEFDFDSTSEKSFKRSQKADHYLELGNRLRARAMLEGDSSGTAALTAADGQTLHVLRATACRVTATFDANDIATNATGAVDVRIDRENGDELRTTVASSETSPGQYYVALTPEDTTTLDRLTVTWTATIGTDEQTLTTYVEVRGARLFSLARLRRQRPFDNETAYPTARLVEARTWAEIELERVCRVAFAPTYFRRLFDGNDRTDLKTPGLRPLTVTAATVDGTAIDTDDLVLYSTGRIYREDGWTAGRRNVEITGTHGYEVPPPRVGSACMELARQYLVGDGTVDPMDCPLVAAAVKEYAAPIGYAMS